MPYRPRRVQPCSGRRRVFHQVVVDHVEVPGVLPSCLVTVNRSVLVPAVGAPFKWSRNGSHPRLPRWTALRTTRAPLRSRRARPPCAVLRVADAMNCESFSREPSLMCLVLDTYAVSYPMGPACRRPWCTSGACGPAGRFDSATRSSWRSCGRRGGTTTSWRTRGTAVVSGACAGGCRCWGAGGTTRQGRTVRPARSTD